MRELGAREFVLSLSLSLSLVRSQNTQCKKNRFETGGLGSFCDARAKEVGNIIEEEAITDRTTKKPPSHFLNAPRRGRLTHRIR